MEFRKSESFDSPAVEDTKSSPHGVYIRKNIVEEVYTDPETSETRPIYRYEEAFISHEEYTVLSATQYAVETSSSNSTSEEEVIDQYTQTLIEEGVI